MSKRSAQPPASRPVSREDVLHLVGDADDATVTAILGTGASYLEIEEAVSWLAGEGEPLGKAGRSLSVLARAVEQILSDRYQPPGRER